MSRPIYLYVTPFFPSPDNWRGAYCFDFVKALMRTDKYDVYVFVPGVGEDYEVDGIKVYRFPTKQLPSNIFPFLFHRYNESSFINKVKEVINSTLQLQLETTTNIAICHAHTANFAIYPLAVKRLYPYCKTLLHHHDLQSFGVGLGILHRNPLYTALAFRIVRKYHERIDTHVFISEAVRRSFLMAPDASWTVYEDYKQQMRGPKFFHCRPVRIKRSIILHNGVDTSIFHSSTTPPPPKIFAIGCIGNFIEVKDYPTLAAALGRLKDLSWQMKIIGTGPARVAFEAQLRELGISERVEFIRERQHEDLAEFYRSLDLFVLPSYFEGFGCVYAEAASCGVPFIACRHQGIEDVLDEHERDVWLVAPKDPVALASRIRWCIETRADQHLVSPVDIEMLVDRFVRELEGLEP